MPIHYLAKPMRENGRPPAAVLPAISFGHFPDRARPRATAKSADSRRPSLRKDVIAPPTKMNCSLPEFQNDVR